MQSGIHIVSLGFLVRIRELWSTARADVFPQPKYEVFSHELVRSCEGGAGRAARKGKPRMESSVGFERTTVRAKASWSLVGRGKEPPRVFSMADEGWNLQIGAWRLQVLTVL